MARRPKRALYKVDGLHLVDRDGYYQIQGFHNGTRYRKTTGVTDLAEASIILDDFLEELNCGWKLNKGIGGLGWHDVARAMYLRHKASAQTRKRAFDINALDIYLEMERTNFQCAISGIPFSREGATKRDGLKGIPNPWAPSIDRIICDHGYTKDNIRVVCLAANIAMNRYGFDVLLRLSRAVVRREGRGEFLAPQGHSASDNDGQVIDFASVLSK